MRGLNLYCYVSELSNLYKYNIAHSFKMWYNIHSYMKKEGLDLQEITVDATVENIRPVTDLIDELLEASNCPMAAQMQIDVAVDEMFANIANYAYRGETGKVTVSAGYFEEEKCFKITFKDQGIPYDPLAKEDPDVTLSAEERKIGGLGIFIVKKTMDDIIYEYKDGYNVLTIVKNY